MAKHLVHLKIVLQCLADTQLFAKMSKCQFCQASIEYLGQIVSAEGVKPYPKKIQAMIGWVVPKNMKQLKGFIGLTSYYKRVIQGYAAITTPSKNLQKKYAFI